MRLFVYGSLRKGQPSAGLLASAKFLGRTTTAAGFQLTDLGEFPGLIRGGEAVVQGELYEIDEPTCSSLDEFEEHPDEYRRERIPLAQGTAMAYLYLHDDPARHRRVPHGDWPRWRRQGPR